MTDFIHEQPKDDPPVPADDKTEREERTAGGADGQKRVYGYVLILFVVAFSLLLWSFLMNQRSNEQVLSELRGSTSTLQSTLDRNTSLGEQVAALEHEVEALQSEVAELEQRAQELENERDEALAERDELKNELAETSAALEEARAAEEAPES